MREYLPTYNRRCKKYIIYKAYALHVGATLLYNMRSGQPHAIIYLVLGVYLYKACMADKHREINIEKNV